MNGEIEAAIDGLIAAVYEQTDAVEHETSYRPADDASRGVDAAYLALKAAIDAAVAAARAGR